MSGPLNSDTIRAGAAGAAGGGGYSIAQSIRFNDDDTPYLQRTPGSAGNDHTWTVSFWIKRGSDIGDTDQQNAILGAGDGANIGGDVTKHDSIGFYNDTIQIFTFAGYSNYTNLRSTPVFRDPSSWYHYVVRYDDTQSTATDRVRVYINGVQVTAFSPANYPDQNAGTSFNTALLQRVGANTISTDRNIDGYLAEIVMIDGTSLGPGSFGETNDDGVWVPINVSGLTFGTNGFYITGETASDLGEDFSGNNNDFASSGLTASDQMSDSPTNNWCTLSSLDAVGPTLSDGNLAFTDSNGSAWRTARGTMAIPSTGKWYWECIAASSGGGGDPNFGIVADTVNTQVSDWYQDALAYAYSTRQDSVVNNDWVGTSRGTYNGGNVLQIAYDSGTGKLHFGIQNSWINGGDPANGSSPDFTTSTTPTFLPYAAIYNNKTGSINFGQSAFAYTPPTGFLALNSANLPAPSITDGSTYFQSALYTGSTSAQDITFSGNSDLAPDWLWFKARSAASNHFLFDKVRGVLKKIESDRTAAEATSTGSMTAFGTDGFSLGDGGSANDINGVSGTTYVAWGWAANGAGSSNEDGSINTTATSANTTAGFSISTYTGTGSNATVGHGLGIAPSLVIIKSRNDTHDWYVRTPALSGTEFLVLNTTAAKGTSSPEVWNSTVPTSSVVSIGTSIGVNRSSYNYVMYCFAEIPGYSSIGSYTGNGNANGPMVNVGFTPSWVIIKKLDGVNDWNIQDTKRSPFNVSSEYLYSNTSAAESNFGSGGIDIVSNGFKTRTAANVVNTSGSTYVYAAFAHSPFKTANAR